MTTKAAQPRMRFRLLQLTTIGRPYFLLSENLCKSNINTLDDRDYMEKPGHISQGNLKEVSAIGPQVTVQLPQLQLPTFSGDPKTWRQFWNSFDVAVHFQAIPDVQKLNYLMSCLRGEALLAVRGYDIALKITISFFERSDRDWKATIEAIERILRQLEAIGENLNHCSIETSIESKLPIWILHKVYEQKKRGAWSIDRLRQILGELVQINEEVARNQSFSNEKKSIDCKQKRASHNNKGETSALSTIKQFKSTKSSGHESTTQPKKIARDKRPCAFCNKDHWDNECSMYPTLKQRIEYLRKITHVLIAFGRGTQQIIVAKETLMFPLQESSQHCAVLCEIWYANCRIKELSKRSQSSFISTKLANRLKLERKETENLSISSFGSKFPRLHQTTKVDIDLPRMISLEQLHYGGDWKRPDILIGADYFFDFMSPYEFYKTSSGFYVVLTKTSDIEQFWKLELIGIQEQPNACDDEKALEQFKKGITKRNNRYQVRWPWKDSKVSLNDNYGLCFGRLKTLVKRVRTDKLLFNQYNEVILQQVQSNIIEEVTPNMNQSGVIHYLPHHEVLTPGKSTTKLRIVYDASTRLKGMKSLNDVLYRGPTTLPDLVGVLLRLRTMENVIIADIEKAFLQLELFQSERNCTRFLWLMNIQGEVTDDNIENLYVDDIILSTKGTEEALKNYGKMKSIFKEASINIREFLSNNEEFNKSIPEHDRAEYDPLGFLVPSMVQFKLFLQHLWKRNYTWDQSISEEDEETWECLIKEWSTDVKDLPRCVIHPSEQMQFHVFTDASSLVYSAAIYVRNYGIEGVKTSLIFAKSRIALIKGITKPRLELLAIIIGVRAAHFVINQLNSRTRSATNKRTIAETICKSNWTMSSLVLISTIFILSVQAKTMKECEWKVGIPFNIPQRAKLHDEQSHSVHTNPRTDTYYQMQQCNTNTTSSHFCRNLDRQKEIDGEEMGQSCPYRKIGEFNTQLSGSHVIIDKLQTSFIFRENGIILNSNCNFSEPYLMNVNIIIDKGTNNLANNIRKQRSDPEGELIMKEVSEREETELDKFDPRNIKYQYLFDVLQIEFKKQLTKLYQRSCQNRNNFLLLIEWLSTVNPTLDVKLLLQRNDIIAKRIKGKLLIALCSFNASEWKTVDFKAGIVSKFEIEKINADLDILAQTLGITNPVHRPTREESLRELIVEQGEELVNQLETEFDETTELIEQELSEVMKRWKLITFSIIVFVILIMIIVIKLKFELIRSLYRFFCIRTSNQRVDNSMELVQVPTPEIGDQKPPNNIQYSSIVLSVNSLHPVSSGMSGNREEINSNLFLKIHFCNK
ncbi:Zinc knuckle family protein [Dirofilaria immitis]|nr:Zinc knuckle family protein [Dirofilaria immitis]